MIDCISLSCPTCGAKLEVGHDDERLACGHCGTESLVRRRGAAVSLRPVVEAIARVQSGTDRTAAELAIARLRGDQAAVKARRAALQASCRTERTCVLVGGLLVLSALLYWKADTPGTRESPGVGATFLVFGAIALWIAYMAARQRRADERLLDAEWREIEQKIKGQVAIAEGRSSADGA